MTSTDYIIKILDVYNVKPHHSSSKYKRFSSSHSKPSEQIRYLILCLQDIIMPTSVLYIDDNGYLSSSNIMGHSSEFMFIRTPINSDMDSIDLLVLHLLHTYKCGDNFIDRSFEHYIQIEQIQELQKEYHKDRCTIVNTETNLFLPLCRIVEGY